MNSDRRTDRPGQGRDARLGAALRANLARRKAQARGRAADSPDETGAAINDDTGMTDKPQAGRQPPDPAPSEEASED